MAMLTGTGRPDGHVLRVQSAMYYGYRTARYYGYIRPCVLQHRRRAGHDAVPGSTSAVLEYGLGTNGPGSTVLVYGPGITVPVP